MLAGARFSAFNRKTDPSDPANAITPPQCDGVFREHTHPRRRGHLTSTWRQAQEARPVRSHFDKKSISHPCSNLVRLPAPARSNVLYSGLAMHGNGRAPIFTSNSSPVQPVRARLSPAKPALRKSPTWPPPSPDHSHNATESRATHLASIPESQSWGAPFLSWVTKVARRQVTTASSVYLRPAPPSNKLFKASSADSLVAMARTPWRNIA